MSKRQRLKAERKGKKPLLVATIIIDIFDDDSVAVRGPIRNPIPVFHVLGKAMIQLAAFYAAQQAEQNPIMQPPSPILPGNPN